MSNDGLNDRVPKRQHRTNNKKSNEHRESKTTSRELDQILSVLRVSRRRCLLYYLDKNRTCELYELVAHLSSSSLETTGENNDQNTGLRTDLIHQDLPLLDDLQLIEFDRRTWTVFY